MKRCKLRDWRGLSNAELVEAEEKIRMAIVQHTKQKDASGKSTYLQADAVICASQGGYYMINLWQLMASQPERTLA